MYERFNDDIYCSIKVLFCFKVEIWKTFYFFLQPSGQLFNPSNVVLEKCKSFPKNDISVERLMGQLDKKLTNVPSYNVFNLQSIILYNDNETDDWWKRKSLPDKEKIINDARKKQKAIFSMNKTRKKELLERHLTIIKDKQDFVKKTKEERQECGCITLRNLETDNIIKKCFCIG